MAIALAATASMPCHAAEHETHGHDGAVQTDLCATHACGCHTCEATPCSDTPEMRLQRIVISASLNTQVQSIVLMRFPETKAVARRVPTRTGGTLASLQTVQLLI